MRTASFPYPMANDQRYWVYTVKWDSLTNGDYLPYAMARMF